MLSRARQSSLLLAQARLASTKAPRGRKNAAAAAPLDDGTLPLPRMDKAHAWALPYGGRITDPRLGPKNMWGADVEKAAEHHTKEHKLLSGPPVIGHPIVAGNVRSGSAGIARTETSANNGDFSSQGFRVVANEDTRRKFILPLVVAVVGYKVYDIWCNQDAWGLIDKLHLGVYDPMEHFKFPMFGDRVSLRSPWSKERRDVPWQAEWAAFGRETNKKITRQYNSLVDYWRERLGKPKVEEPKESNL